MKASLPPISRFIRAIRPVQASATFLPVATEPVQATQSTPGGEAMAAEGGAGGEGTAARTRRAPASRLTTPAGRCSKTEASARVESGVSSEGLQTTLLPAASAGATFQASSSNG